MEIIYLIILKLINSYISMILLILPFLRILKKNLISIEHRIGIIIFSFFIITIFTITGIPTINELYYNPNVNILLFRYFIIIFYDYFFNIILFMPFGFFIACLWEKFQNIKIAFLYGFLLSLFIEIFQLFGSRVTDINDLLTNTLGSIIGYEFFNIIRKVFPNIINKISLKKNMLYNNKIIKYEFVIIIFLCWISIFLIRPFIENLL